MRILPLDEAVTNRAILLRQDRAIGIADAIIASTALIYELPLVTRNTADFQHVAGLTLLDPCA